MSGAVPDPHLRLELLCEVVQRHGLTSLHAGLESCRRLLQGQDFTIAIFGRFKAGKSTLLNQVVGRDVLPVGALPVTAIVTELSHGDSDRATVRYLDGHAEQVSLTRISEFITERQNPDNRRGIASVFVELVSLQPLRGVRLIDTPGLDSAFEHNTRTTHDWLPRVAIAVVAVPADSPLGAGDLELIAQLRSYSSRISVVLTKFDLLSVGEQSDVMAFVSEQINKRFGNVPVPVYPYSVRDGYEALRERMKRDLILDHVQQQEDRRAELLAYKLSKLSANAEDYLRIAIRAAEAREMEREELRRHVLSERNALQDLHNSLRVLANHAAASLRNEVGRTLSRDQDAVRDHLSVELHAKFSEWERSLANTVVGFSSWLQSAMARELISVSFRHRSEFQGLVQGTERKLAQAVQDFENRVAERAANVLGIRMRPVEVSIAVREPEVPDVSIGKVFDHAWELVSWAVPMTVFGSVVRKHLARRLHWEVTKHLSRLTSQWEERLRDAIQAAQSQAQSAANEFVSTLERMSSTGRGESEQLHRDLQLLTESDSASL